ncbi:hypothetical protein K488DRAFT_87633 [Vararia minispora EC-137]|uniref:Uncharacterized protein n=1 Tax=Vararia minispora EC-137 TaxID=1314806 RepID=A0ACB8QG86_9AGAM|nr:hypothetical protein K488DRAFT_87633 [Vararia minispora EC-137]
MSDIISGILDVKCCLTLLSSTPLLKELCLDYAIDPDLSQKVYPGVIVDLPHLKVAVLKGAGPELTSLWSHIAAPPSTSLRLDVSTYGDTTPNAFFNALCTHACASGNDMLVIERCDVDGSVTFSIHPSPRQTADQPWDSPCPPILALKLPYYADSTCPLSVPAILHQLGRIIGLCIHTFIVACDLGRQKSLDDALRAFTAVLTVFASPRNLTLFNVLHRADFVFPALSTVVLSGEVREPAFLVLGARAIAGRPVQRIILRGASDGGWDGNL